MKVAGSGEANATHVRSCEATKAAGLSIIHYRNVFLTAAVWLSELCISHLASEFLAEQTRVEPFSLCAAEALCTLIGHL